MISALATVEIVSITLTLLLIWIAIERWMDEPLTEYTAEFVMRNVERLKVAWKGKDKLGKSNNPGNAEASEKHSSARWISKVRGLRKRSRQKPKEPAGDPEKAIPV